ncbi:MAG: DMT family transporter [Negativicutes bacterium]|nr:DMT family transporter [Negativicutes bacterium]
MQLRATVLLLITAAIWGFAFVAQRVGMEYIGPYTFNGVRFALGGLSLLPVIYFFSDRPPQPHSGKSTKNSLPVGLLAGLILFVAASLQQIGLIYTTAGKSAFITCLYIILVPISGIFLKHRIRSSTWLGSVLAITGLYLLCVKEGFAISYGDFLELMGAFFWTAHILLIDKYSRRVDVLKLAFFQFITCAVLSGGAALILEPIALDGILLAAVPILYGGLGSVGVAYTLQIVGQKYAPPSHAAILLSLETVFAAVGGYLILDERLGPAELAGCGLMMAGMLVSQLGQLNTPGNNAETT